MRLGIILLFIFFISFSSAVEIKDLSCPEQSYFNQDFLCSLEIEEVSGLYDLKIYITGNDSGINKIWGDRGWTRADWYFKSVINKDGIYEIKILIDKEFSGEAKGVLRLRESGSSYAFYEEDFLMTIGEIKIEDEPDDGEEEINQTIENNSTEINNSNSSDEGMIINLSNEEDEISTEKETIFLGNTISEEPIDEDSSKKVIKLSSDISSEKEIEIVYESKSERIKRYVLYFFIGFLFIAFVYLLIEKLKNGKRNYDY